MSLLVHQLEEQFSPLLRRAYFLLLGEYFRCILHAVATKLKKKIQICVDHEDYSLYSPLRSHDMQFGSLVCPYTDNKTNG